MPQVPTVGKFFAVTAAIALIYLLVSSTYSVRVDAAPTSTAAPQDQIAAPPSKAAMDELMKQKLTAAQNALAAVSREDFEQLHDIATQLIALSHKEIWEQMASPRFVQDTADFVAAVEFLDRMAGAHDVDGVNLAFVRLTMSCADCHRHMRTPTVAKSEPHRNQIAEKSLAGL